MSDILSFGFGKEDIKGGVFEKYKGKKGEVHRCGIVFSDPDVLFSGAKIHYEPNSKRYFICKKGVCCEKLGVSKYRIGAVLIKYGTDKLGGLKAPFAYDLFPWIFSETCYVKLQTVHNEFPLTTHDLKISCTNEEFQHLDITPCNESVWQAKDELKKKVLEDAKSVWDYVKKSIAADLSVEEIKDLFSMSSGVGTDPTTKLDLDSILTSA